MTLTQINKAGLDELALDHVFTIGASGSSAYTFQGEGLNGTVNNPTLYLTRGKTYRFENGSGGHPIRIQSTSGASGTAYNTGVTNNAGSGTVIVEVQHDAPDVLYYQCTSHAAMNGILYITGALADGGVTTAKIANDAVTTAKIVDDAVTAAKIADGTIQQFNLASNAVTTAKINANAVTTAKMADGSINTTVTIAIDAANTEDNYDGVSSQTVTVTTTDNDTAGFTLNKTTVSVSEGATTETFTVVLDVEPVGNVVFDITSADTGEATVSPATLTFTTGNWNNPQTVTVTGVDDFIIDGNQTTTVTVSVDSASTDDNYDGV